ncbi:MAG: hypothetical protein GY810_09540 [Aureispira sp.]|nr:hypothetical protein [Aureispira sp.]
MQYKNLFFYIILTSIFSCNTEPSINGLKQNEVLSKIKGIWTSPDAFYPPNSTVEESILIIDKDSLHIPEFLGLNSTKNYSFKVSIFNNKCLLVTRNKDDSTFIYPSKNWDTLNVKFSTQIRQTNQNLIYTSISKNSLETLAQVEPTELYNSAWYGQDSLGKILQLHFSQEGIIYFCEIDNKKKEYLYRSLSSTSSRYKNSYLLSNSEYINMQDSCNGFQSLYGYLNGVDIQNLSNVNCIKDSLNQLGWQGFNNYLFGIKQGWAGVLEFPNAHELNLKTKDGTLLKLYKDSAITQHNKALIQFGHSYPTEDYYNRIIQTTDSSQRVFSLTQLPTNPFYLGKSYFSECLNIKPKDYIWNSGVPNNCESTGTYRISPRRNYLFLIKQKKGASSKDFLEIISITPNNIEHQDSFPFSIL